MKKLSFYIASFIILGFSSCKTTRTSSAAKDDGKIDVTFLQINDVYEIAPLQGGRVGGVARVATLKKELLKQNPNTFLVIAGDFFSPSVYNSLKYEGKRIRGRQMVESLNAAGMDIAIFGNHEFDIAEQEFQDRIDESHFQWVSSNSFRKTSSGVVPFSSTGSGINHPIPETYFINVKDADGTTAKIGFLGLTLPFNKANYVSYSDPFSTAEKLYNQIKDSCDAVVAITHQSQEDDSLLAIQLPKLAMIIGGHEHDMRFLKVGDVYISKAHANAKSAYIISLNINKNNGHLKVVPRLKMIDESIAIDSATNVVVQKWMSIGEKNYSSLGFDATKIVREKGEPLEGRETEIRSRPTNLTRIIASAFEKAVSNADLAIFNSGSIRVDDIVQMPVTQYDIIRSLPYGGSIMEVDMKGSLLQKVLEIGRNNVGSGGFLQYSAFVNYNPANKLWTIKNEAIQPEKVYHVAISDFLLTGGEANLGFLTIDNPDIVKVYSATKDIADSRSDIRLAIIRYMEALK
ncbi:MAG: bifunctional metallophosphatase/5'-nucleotidase [Ginsengibacter sp.]